jgi:hypothetical protein
MNTGIGDAVNLAWKLASVLQARADPGILDSYESERIAFAHRLVATTDRAFQFINHDGRLARLIRVRVVPVLLPALFRLRAVRRLMFLTISQTNVSYRGSPLGVGTAGRVVAGDRLPWLRLPDGSDNFASLRNVDWQAHVYGQPSEAIEQACGIGGLELHHYPWNDAAARAGLDRDAFYLLRPDGYVGLAAGSAGAVNALRDYQGRFGLSFQGTGQVARRRY